MPFETVYAPHPPQFALTLTPEELIRRDARFAHIQRLQERGTLDLLLQDSADLQNAHLTLRWGEVRWQGTPGGNGGERLWRDRDGKALNCALGLDLTHTEVQAVEASRLAAEVISWDQGAVYILTGKAGLPTVTRRLNLGDFCDRLEWDFLTDTGFAAIAEVQAHRLGKGGQPVVWRTALVPPERAELGVGALGLG
ncbi:hypothetical protein [Deinococcus hopiensis]|uniref:Uncharacterized protein n=1 Tax=Deinococcus hopiensis KR-140 TaxID=695939 RepID=A0A1W1UNR8_9DEIO|nr:hypothetical protein [Deinococcus hopiensis]SMB82752.1 hypothetical protein SAMN00790413_04131 [Deinococcus hopiensis KR-140]